MTRLIHLLDTKVALYQPDKGFRTSQDAVLLAAACPAQGDEHVLDMGCGVGGASFCLLWRCPQIQLTGIDIEPGYLTLAARNAEENNHHIHLHETSVTDFRPAHKTARFDHIICNPPFFKAGAHSPSPETTQAAARGFVDTEHDLNDWVRCAFENLKPRGSFSLIHQVDKLDDILHALGKKFGAAEIIPIYSKAGEAAKRIIITAYKDRRGGCILHPPILMHNPDLSFTKHADMILRDGASFATLLKK